jgi:thymidylate synthase ThyX
MTYRARVILDSIGPNQARLTTFELTYPRFIHAEFMTHRLFSRNAASSRAIPTEKLLARIERDPAMPVWWGKNQSGMQAKEQLPDDAIEEVKSSWLFGLGQMLHLAGRFKNIGLHKQIANRVVEPWMNITVIVTATELDNYWGLRVDPDAQPELQHISSLALSAYNESTPRKLASGEWHLPYVTGFDEEDLRAQYFLSLPSDEADRTLCQISVGRCARVSYLTHDGKRDPMADQTLAEKLAQSGHMSPYEHVAQAMEAAEWKDYARQLADNWAYYRVPVGNFWGWKQFRKLLSDEHNYLAIKQRRETSEK